MFLSKIDNYEYKKCMIYLQYHCNIISNDNIPSVKENIFIHCKIVGNVIYLIIDVVNSQVALSTVKIVEYFFQEKIIIVCKIVGKCYFTAIFSVFLFNNLCCWHQGARQSCQQSSS